MSALNDAIFCRDLMVDFFQVSPDTNINDTLEDLFSRKISSVLVTESGRLRGVATVRDFVTRVPWGEKPIKKIKVKSIMTTKVLSVRPEDEIKKVIDLMYYQDIRVIPVVSGQTVKGIITRTELAKLFASRFGSRYRVGDLMTYRYTTATVHESVTDVLKMIEFSGDKFIILLSGKEVVGVVTLSDILQHLYSTREFKCQHQVTEIMTKNPIMTTKEEKCDKIAGIMLKHKISALPVVMNELEGLISYKCFFKVLEY